MAFLCNWFFVFAPDRRFEAVRRPTLDAQFKRMFKTQLNKLKVDERLPFRINVMQPRRGLRRRRLEIVYSFGLETSDPDYAITLLQGQGLCWQVFTTGMAGWFDRREHNPAHFGLSAADLQKTGQVWAILSLPIRRTGRHAAVAVLNFDALSEPAADQLKRWKEEMETHQNLELVVLADFIGLYY